MLQVKKSMDTCSSQKTCNTPGMKSWEDAKIKQLLLHKIPDYDPKHRKAVVDAAKEA
jgi:hypothetical protein